MSEVVILRVLIFPCSFVPDSFSINVRFIFHVHGLGDDPSVFRLSLLVEPLQAYKRIRVTLHCIPPLTSKSSCLLIHSWNIRIEFATITGTSFFADTASAGGASSGAQMHHPALVRSHVFHNFAPHACQSRLVCGGMEGNVCGEYGFKMNTVTRTNG